MGPRLLYMKFHGIDQVHLIPLLREPESVDTCPASNIENNGWRWRKLASENYLGTKSLKLTLTPMKASAIHDLSSNVLESLAEVGSSSPPKGKVARIYQSRERLGTT
jgi:hypothetical protein